jgi:hypothetical protein
MHFNFPCGRLESGLVRPPAAKRTLQTEGVTSETSVPYSLIGTQEDSVLRTQYSVLSTQYSVLALFVSYDFRA